MKQHLFLLRELVRRDFSSRYAGSVLGFLWSFVQPLWMLLLFTFVFSTVMKISLVGERTGSFGIFLFCGLLPWTAVNEGITRSATAITEHANLVKKLNFPAELLILSAAASALVQQAIAGIVFAVVLVALGELGWASLPLLLLAVPLQLALTLGLGFILSSLQVFFRDIAQVLGLAFTGWFYLTPIVYSLEQVPEPYDGWIRLNPLTALVSLYRQALLGGGLVPPDGTAALAAVSLGLAMLGWWLFRRLKPTFADEI